MSSATIIKFDTATGDPVWTFASGEYTETEHPVALGWAGKDIAVVTAAYIPDRNTVGVGVRVISADTGESSWNSVIIDDNAGLRDDGLPSFDGNKTKISTDGQHSIANVALHKDHLLLALPRSLRLGENQLDDGGDILGISRYGTTTISTSTHTIGSWADAMWDPVTDASYTWSSYGPLDGSLVTSMQMGISTIPVAGTIDRLYSLPPTNLHSTPSLDVVNVAKVGQLIISGTQPVPTTLIGQPGDTAGSIRADKTGIYYCTDTYASSGDNAWAVAEFTDRSAPRFKSGPIGYNALNGSLCGCVDDKLGDIRICNNTAFICIGPYVNTNTNIWQLLTPYVIQPGLNANVAIDNTNTTDPRYPSGQILSSYTIELSPATNAVYDIPGWYAGKPEAGTTIFQYLVTRPITITLSTNDWIVGTPSTDWATFDITLNNVSVGQITFQPGIAGAYDAVGSSAQLGAGTILRVIAPSTQDATLADVSFTITGTLN